MKKKHSLILNALSLTAIIAMILYLMWTGQVDELGRQLSIVILIGLLTALFFVLRSLRKVSPEEMEFAPPSNATAKEKINYYESSWRIGRWAFLFLSLWTAWEVYGLETGQEERASLWGPVPFIYSTFGFWPAVCFTPLFAWVCWLVLRKKIKELQ